MKKILLSSVLAASLSASTFFGFGYSGFDIKDCEDCKNKDVDGFDFYIKGYNFSEEGGLVGLLKVGAKDFESEYQNNTEKGKITSKYQASDVMLGYGFGKEVNGDTVGIDFLVGLNHQKIDFKDTWSEQVFFMPTEQWQKILIKTNAIKFGVSVMMINPNNIYANLDLFLKHYTDDKREIMYPDVSKNRFSGELGLGYKFRGKEDGAYIGAIVGYHTNLMQEGGAHLGVNLGYMFK